MMTLHLRPFGILVQQVLPMLVRVSIHAYLDASAQHGAVDCSVLEWIALADPFLQAVMHSYH
jgi:hypothetical protein